MPADPRILALLQRVKGDSLKEQKAARLLHWYGAECLKLIGTIAAHDKRNKEIEERGEELYMHMCNVVEPMGVFDPAPLLSAPLHPLTQAQVTDYFTLHLLARFFMDHWNTVGVLGFVSRDKDHVPQLLNSLEQLRKYLAYSNLIYSS